VPKDLRKMIGTLPGIYLFALGPIMIIALYGGITPYFRNMDKDDKPYWVLQQVSNEICKINACTDESIPKFVKQTRTIKAK